MQSSNVLIVTKYYRLQIPSGMFRTDYFIRITSRSYTSHFSFDLFYHIFDFLSVDETIRNIWKNPQTIRKKSHQIHSRKTTEKRLSAEIQTRVTFGYSIWSICRSKSPGHQTDYFCRRENSYF